MKRSVAFVAAAALWAVLGGVGNAGWCEYDESESHPLRLAAYAIHPVGFVAEWLIARPLHFFVSLPGVEMVFGHRSHAEEGYR